MVQCVAAADAPVRSDRANVVAFPAQAAKYVRFVISATNHNQPCLDELEVYGPDAKCNLALASRGAKATASSCLPGYPMHQIPHLNDGRYGNDRSWIAASREQEWAQIELSEPAKIAKVVFSRDRMRHFSDRVPTRFEVRLSLDGEAWTTVKKVSTTAAPVALHRPRQSATPFVPPAPPSPVGGPRVTDAFSAQILRKDKLGFANLALNSKATPAASSLLPGHAIHQIAHLNDGLAGNKHSWISKQEPSWAQIDLGDVYWVYKVAFGSDSSGQHADRAATTFAILAATEYDKDPRAPTWQTLHRQTDGPPVHLRTAFTFKPVRARWLRIAIDATNGNQARVDEIEVFGQSAPIPPDKIGPVRKGIVAQSGWDNDDQLRYAFLGEEHAWLKACGRADLSARLVPYNGRVKEYPRHVGEDRLPLPPLSSEPKIDGNLNDDCWRWASRGVVRVAWPYDFQTGPMISYELSAGWRGGDLFLAIRTDRLCSRHVAVVSSGDWHGCGVVAWTKTDLVFKTYGKDRKLIKRTPIDGAFNKALTHFEFRLPLALLPGCKDHGVRVGLGMGGKHTGSLGWAVNFAFSSLVIAEQPPCVAGAFRVRLGVPAGGEAVTVWGNVPALETKLTLSPGHAKDVKIPAKRGPIGPEIHLTVQEDQGPPYDLHLFRYDPLERTLRLTAELADRLGAKGLDVRAEREELAELRKQHEQLMSASIPDRRAERDAFFQARLAKRGLFFREPDLDPIAKILFVKRRAFRPSHNYSTCFDAPFRPGGGVCALNIPRHDGRFEPGRATVARLYDSGSGIVRNPMADFDAAKIYFGYRPSAEGYYHIMSMDADGGNLEQITDGPFNDFWPCPLPDGGLAFISSRCTCRALCWRPQALILFRMDTDGKNIQPLSRANLTEWAPSVMSDGRIIWTRWEYIDKGADFGHTLWSIRPDGSYPELIFGNTIIQPNGYANGREVPGTNEICCTLISHFGDLNGPIALLDVNKGRFDPKAITSITPEVPWPGNWPLGECFRDPVPLARDYFLCSHAPRTRFGIYVIDRFGNREMLHADQDISSMCPTVFRSTRTPPVLASSKRPEGGSAEFVMLDVYEGISHAVERGRVKYIRVVEEVRSDVAQLPGGEYRKDHNPFVWWYAAPVDRVSGPHGWPAYVAKAIWGIVPVEEDGSARFTVPAGRTLYFQALDKDFNELQRMRSVCHLQPGETRSCVGCHEGRHTAPSAHRRPMAMAHAARRLDPPPWGAGPFSFEKVVQPVLDAKCVRCHNEKHKLKLDFRGVLDKDRIPASYRTLVSRGLVHYVDCGYNSGGCEKLEPLTFGSVKSKLWKVLGAGHNGVKLTTDQMRAIKAWTDMNCPLWPDYVFRPERPGPPKQLTLAD